MATLVFRTLLAVSASVSPLEELTFPQEPAKPNVIFVLCDDLGYGDVHCLAPETSKIPTPGADQLASEGMTFTDAHSGSSVCTPTRYGLLTGRYSWRSSLQKGVVTGFAPCLIPAERPTVASFLKSQGYDTAIVGKWHLNFEYLNPATGEPYAAGDHKLPPVGSKIPDGPLERGFDEFYGFHHARQMEAVVEGDAVIEHRAPIEMAPALEARCVRYLESRKGVDKPFFLYVPLGSPHGPIVPATEWQGRSMLGAYGDFVMQTDHALVAIMEALEENELADNTLLIFTSDNGTSRIAKIGELAKKGHRVSAGFRGSKADIWDGGHRVPFLVRWPGVVEAGAKTEHLVGLGDFFATVADVLQVEPPAGSCEDSVSFLSLLVAKEDAATRSSLIHHSISGHFAYRRIDASGDWKLVLARGSGGWSAPREEKVDASEPDAQLYNMRTDPGETTNLAEKEPGVVAALLKGLSEDVARGRTTPGPAAKNDVPEIDLWKSELRKGWQ